MQLNSGNSKSSDVLAGLNSSNSMGHRLDERSLSKSSDLSNSCQSDITPNDFELIQRLHSNLEILSEMTDRLGFMMREIQYLTR